MASHHSVQRWMSIPRPLERLREFKGEGVFCNPFIYGHSVVDDPPYFTLEEGGFDIGLLLKEDSRMKNFFSMRKTTVASKTIWPKGEKIEEKSAQDRLFIGDTDCLLSTQCKGEFSSLTLDLSDRGSKAKYTFELVNERTETVIQFLNCIFVYSKNPRTGVFNYGGNSVSHCLSLNEILSGLKSGKVLKNKGVISGRMTFLGCCASEDVIKGFMGDYLPVFNEIVRIYKLDRNAIFPFSFKKESVISHLNNWQKKRFMVDFSYLMSFCGGGLISHDYNVPVRKSLCKLVESLGLQNVSRGERKVKAKVPTEINELNTLKMEFIRFCEEKRSLLIPKLKKTANKKVSGESKKNKNKIDGGGEDPEDSEIRVQIKELVQQKKLVADSIRKKTEEKKGGMDFGCIVSYGGGKMSDYLDSSQKSKREKRDVNEILTKFIESKRGDVTKTVPIFKFPKTVNVVEKDFEVGGIFVTKNEAYSPEKAESHLDKITQLINDREVFFFGEILFDTNKMVCELDSSLDKGIEALNSLEKEPEAPPISEGLSRSQKRKLLKIEQKQVLKNSVNVPIPPDSLEVIEEMKSVITKEKNLARIKTEKYCEISGITPKPKSDKLLKNADFIAANGKQICSESLEFVECSRNYAMNRRAQFIKIGVEKMVKRVRRKFISSRNSRVVPTYSAKKAEALMFYKEDKRVINFSHSSYATTIINNLFSSIEWSINKVEDLISKPIRKVKPLDKNKEVWGSLGEILERCKKLREVVSELNDLNLEVVYSHKRKF